MTREDMTRLVAGMGPTSRRTFCPEDGSPCYTPSDNEPDGFECANYGLCKSFEPAPAERAAPNPNSTEGE